MKTIAVVFAAALALGAVMPAAQAAQNAVSTKVETQGLLQGQAVVADDFSSRHRGHRGGWRGHRGGWHGHHHWRGHRHGYGHRHWRGHRHWYGYRHWRGHRHCWNTWRYGRRIVVCR